MLTGKRRDVPGQGLLFDPEQYAARGLKPAGGPEVMSASQASGEWTDEQLVAVQAPAEPVCWLPDGEQAPVTQDPAKVAQARGELLAYPAWWGRGDDRTGEHERRMVAYRTRGFPEDRREQAMRPLIIAWRARQAHGGAEPTWEGWCEFDVALEDGRVVQVLSYGSDPAVHGTTGTFCRLDLRGPVSVTGDRVVWGCRGTETDALPGETLRDYAERQARREAAELREAGKPRARKARKGAS